MKSHTGTGPEPKSFSSQSSALTAISFPLQITALQFMANEMSHHNFSCLHIPNLAPLQSPMACPTYTACLPGHPFPLPAAQPDTPPWSPIVHPRGNFSNGSYGKLVGGTYYFLASCNEIQQLGRRSWKYHMTISSQQNSGLCLPYGDACGYNDSGVFPLCRGAPLGEVGIKQNFLQQVTYAALREIYYKHVLEEHQCRYS